MKTQHMHKSVLQTVSVRKGAEVLVGTKLRTDGEILPILFSILYNCPHLTAKGPFFTAVRSNSFVHRKHMLVYLVVRVCCSRRVK